MTNVNNLKNRLRYLQKRIKKLEGIVDAAPPGTLYARTGDKGYQYTKHVHLEDGTSKEIYLSRTNPELVPLAEKRYALKELVDLRQEMKLVRKQIDFLEKDPCGPAFLKSHPGIECLLSPGMKTLPKQAKEWIGQSYKKNQAHPESLIYSTVEKGLMVRSKAESDLVAQFRQYGVPFRYEEMINCGGTELAMDFTLLNVRTASIYYWDHRGLSDEAKYLEKVHYCEKLYQKVGIIPWVNLIVTTESKDHPLDIQWVRNLIEYYLL